MSANKAHGAAACPFCGLKDPGLESDGPNCFQVACGGNAFGCGAMGPEGNDADDAIVGWNELNGVKNHER